MTDGQPTQSQSQSQSRDTLTPDEPVKRTKRSIPELQSSAEPLVMVTAYDYPSALLAEAAGVDLILVGDSLGNVVLGYDSTALVTLEDMIHHARAARRGAPNTFLVVDMPFGTYHTGVTDAMRAAVRIIQETSADAVKLEGDSTEILQVIDNLTRNGVPVMGHVGLTPQTATALGGLKVQGKDDASAKRNVDGAVAVEKAGAFACVLETVPARLAKLISDKLSIPTIGIGAGVNCDGQVLVWHDLLGIYDEAPKKISKRYAELAGVTKAALEDFAAEVRSRTFPAKENSFIMKNEVLDKLY